MVAVVYIGRQMRRGFWPLPASPSKSAMRLGFVLVVPVHFVIATESIRQRHLTRHSILINVSDVFVLQAD